MLDPIDVATQRWYAVPDDMSARGGWCIMNTPKSPVYADPAFDEVQIARYLSEYDAKQIASTHNANLLLAEPGPPGDARLLDQLSTGLERAVELLRDTEKIPAYQPMTEIRHLRSVLTEVMQILSLLVDNTVRLNAHADSRA